MIKKKGHNNQYYYSGLIILHSLLLIFVFFKKKNRKEILLTFLSIVGFAFHFEYPLYISKAYRYRTKLIKNKEQDNSFGSVLSQGLFVPSIALFISTFHLGWRIKLFFTVVFVLIEKYFRVLKIYQNKWWHTTYTLIFIFAYLFISDTIYKGIKRGNKVILRIALYNIIHIIHMNIYFVFSLLKMVKYEPFLFPKNPWYDHYSFIKIYVVIETLLTTYVIEQKKIWLKTVPITLNIITDTFLIKMRILKIKGSYWLTLFPTRFFLYFTSLYIQKWIKRYENVKR